MITTQRDTQFAGFAKLHYAEIKALHFTLYARIAGLRPIEEIVDAIEDEIKKLMAQRAYDLAIHVTDHVRGAITRNPHLALQGVPDLTAWPEDGHA